MDIAAWELVKQWTFVPAQENGKAVEKKAVTNVMFRLHSKQAASIKRSGLLFDCNKNAALYSKGGAPQFFILNSAFLIGMNQ